MTITADAIVNLLATNDRAVGRALIVLRNRQTADEQVSESTKHHNNRGFRPCHARMGTSMANFFERAGYLTPKQVAYWRTKEKTGKMRIAIYWRQLMEEAERKAAAKRQEEDGAVIEQWEQDLKFKADFAALEAAAEERAYLYKMARDAQNTN
jgi:hypothetical protein